MDLAEPAATLIGPIAAAILRTLSTRSTALTEAQVARLSAHGTPAGIRRRLRTLAQDGILTVEHIGDLPTYSLNHDHVLYEAISPLLDARALLRRRLRQAFNDWDPAPEFAALFGSSARGDGDGGSDVDILLLRPKLTATARPRWLEQVHRLRRRVRSWTGNEVDIQELSANDLRLLIRQGAPVVEGWRQDLIVLAGAEPGELAPAG